MHTGCARLNPFSFTSYLHHAVAASLVDFSLIRIFFIYAHQWSGFWGSSDDSVLSNYDSHVGMREIFWGQPGFGQAHLEGWVFEILLSRTVLLKG